MAPIIITYNQQPLSTYDYAADLEGPCEQISLEDSRQGRPTKRYEIFQDRSATRSHSRHREGQTLFIEGSRHGHPTKQYKIFSSAQGRSATRSHSRHRPNPKYMLEDEWQCSSGVEFEVGMSVVGVERQKRYHDCGPA
ncbi:uncharacterized protein PAC_06006 [Phialocephala subalpina]|uniref:Uncharacterized protein n=1 Tax=Phialocephala subalpina TaxID=576137 RepID=A0A1L7WTL5_9HELO|nr:uncharacterized protein PAC_06006 [Phialocephala subalpina]